MMGGREETWTARVSATPDPRLAERGWVSFVEWYPRPCDIDVARAIVRGLHAECVGLAEGQQEPLRSMLLAIENGCEPERQVIEVWDYADPDSTSGYDEVDVMRQLRELVR
jgi:hypothetical protein